MKKFITRILLFAAIVVALDLSYGAVMGYMHDHLKGGGMAKRLYVAQQCHEEIMMFGSSRMCHHYNPMLIEDSLGMTCFNAGEDGNGIIMAYGFLQMVLERYTPKMVIYDLSGYDFEADDRMKYIAFLKPYYDHECVREIISEISPIERYKMYSSLYRYNSFFLRIVGGFVSSSSVYQKGYLPLSKTMDYEVDIPKQNTAKVDSLKLAYLDKMISLCDEKGIVLVFCISPRYKAQDSDWYGPVKDLCTHRGAHLLDYNADLELAAEKTYYQDQTHMNSKGADVYTKKVIADIRHLFL